MKQEKFSLNIKTFLFLTFFCFALSQSNAQYVYWTEYTSGPGNTKIVCVKIDGTDYSSITIADNSFPQDLGIHSEDIYWSEFLPSTSKINHSFWSLVNTKQLISNLSYCRSIAIDHVNSEIYWSSSKADSNKISQCNMDDTEAIDLINFGPGSSNIRQIAIDVPGNKMFWVDFGQGVVGKADLDGTNSSNIVTGGAGKGFTGIALDPINERIYWTEINQNVINSIKTDGTEPASGLTSGLDRPQYITFYDGKLYWAEAGNSVQSIKCGNVNAAGIISDVVTLHSATNPGGIFVGIPPENLPIEIVSFTAKQNINNVELNWKTVTEVNSYGFEIERKGLSPAPSPREGKEGWEKIGFVPGAGNSSSYKLYNFVDNNIVSGGNYIYRLKKMDLDGSFNYSDEVQVNTGNIVPAEYELYNNFPNPFNPTTRIRYSLPEKGEVNLSVYNLIGEKVSELVNKLMNEGTYETEFSGDKLASGIYIYKLTIEGKVPIVKRMVLLK